jgi:hypothetical protein
MRIIAKGNFLANNVSGYVGKELSASEVEAISGKVLEELTSLGLVSIERDQVQAVSLPDIEPVKKNNRKKAQ